MTVHDMREPHWGHKVEIWEVNGLLARFVGWMTPHPAVTDLIVMRNRQDGGSPVYRVLSVTAVDDPRDMFWADVMWQESVTDPKEISALCEIGVIDASECTWRARDPLRTDGHEKNKESR